MTRPQPSFASRSWPWLRIVSVADPTITPGFRGFFVGAQPHAARLEKIAEQAARQHGRLKYQIAKVFGRDELLQAIEVNKARGIAGRLIVDFQRV